MTENSVENDNKTMYSVINNCDSSNLYVKYKYHNNIQHHLSIEFESYGKLHSSRINAGKRYSYRMFPAKKIDRTSAFIENVEM